VIGLQSRPNGRRLTQIGLSAVVRSMGMLRLDRFGRWRKEGVAFRVLAPMGYDAWESCPGMGFE
jgi:hypothetical protein